MYDKIIFGAGGDRTRDLSRGRQDSQVRVVFREHDHVT